MEHELDPCPTSQCLKFADQLNKKNHVSGYRVSNTWLLLVNLVVNLNFLLYIYIFLFYFFHRFGINGIKLFVQ